MFVVWDYLVFSLVLLVSASIGVFYGCSGGRQKTTAEFFMGDRKMQLIPVSLSMLASFMSAIMLLGTPAEVYLYGTQYLIIGVGYIMLMPVAAYLYIPIFYHLQLTSAYEVRYICSLFGLIRRLYGKLETQLNLYPITMF